MPSAWQIADHEAQDWRSPESIDNLRLVHDLPKPIPGPGEVLFNIKAAALNAREMMVTAHSPAYPDIAIPDLVPCADAAGIIEAVGPGSKWKVGDKVLLNPINWIDGPATSFAEGSAAGSGKYDGTLREYAVFADDRFVRSPSHLSYTEAAALPGAAGTASNTLFFSPIPFQKGDIVLTQGTGGVSTFAIQVSLDTTPTKARDKMITEDVHQLAAVAGATVIATSSSDEKLEEARKLGATHLINYNKTPDWATEVLRLTNGRGADHVLDVAGAGTVEQSLKAAKQGGLVSLIGFLTESQQLDLVMPIIAGSKIVRGVLGLRTDMLAKVTELYEEHQLHPPIANAYKWHEVKEAYKELNQQSAVGKIVIEVGA